MKYLLLNIFAAGLVIGIYAWIRFLYRYKKPKRMKKILLFVAMAALVSCSKSVDPPAGPAPSTGRQVKFYSTNAVVVTKVITVKIGANDYGQLHYSASVPGCDAPVFKAIKLAPGNYIADVIDEANPNASKQVGFTVAQGTRCVFFNLK